MSQAISRIPATRHVVAGTAGHIDHGKSALVRALTGTDPDRLKEEKLRGITIDLGFAHLDLGEVQVAFVDVPGHERFVKNMLAGVGGIDFVLLVVAADESVMPQTREHFDICRLLGIPAGAVVLTKTDLVETELVEVVQEEVRELVRRSFLEDADVVPVSSRTGEGIEHLKAVLRRLALSAPERAPDRLFRLPIDRSFSIRGFGTVVTGTLTSGQIETEQEVELLPSGLITRVRGLEVHGSPSSRAVAGQRTAVNLQGVDLADVERGMVLAPPHRFRAGSMLDVRLDLLPSAPHPLRNLVKVRLHHGTAEVLARVALLGRETLPPGETTYAQLRLDRPIVALHGDPFIVRQFSPAVTIGGGRVLDPVPTKHKSTETRAARAMATLDQESLGGRIRVLVATHPRGAVSAAELNARLGLREATLLDACRELARKGELTLLEGASPLMLLPDTIAALEVETLRQITQFHDQNPLQKGIPREELRTRVFHAVPAEVFRFCLDSLARRQAIAVREDIVSLHGREVQLDAQEADVRARIEDAFRHGRFQPPLLSELTEAVGAGADEVRKIYFWMLKERILIKITEDMAYHRETLEEIKARVRERFAAGGRFGVAEFKDLLDLTRKHAIPLLEFLDRERFTRRQGNDRVLL